MKKIKIKFCDMPTEFNENNNYILDALKERYQVEFSERPDFVFYGVFSLNHFKYQDAVQVLICGEPIVPNFNDCDYAIGYVNMTFGDRYLRIDTFLANGNGTAVDGSIQDRTIVTSNMADRRFCNFVYNNQTNGEGTKVRIDFCKMLMKYKNIDCPGRVLHNMSAIELAERYTKPVNNGELVVVDDSWKESKISFLKKYKFTIAFENVFASGVTTEKLLHPFMAYSIPIYWGNPDVNQEYNPKAFINCNDYANNFERVIQRVIELDNDRDQYLRMLKEKPFRDDYKFDEVKRFHDFLYMIIERGNHPLRRIGSVASWDTQSSVLAYRMEKTTESVKDYLAYDHSGSWHLFLFIKKLIASPLGKPFKYLWKIHQQLKNKV